MLSAARSRHFQVPTSEENQNISTFDASANDPVSVSET
jgi:hypothetical protein